MYVLKQIEEKGYDRATAEKITHNLFAQMNPNGLSMQHMINGVLTYDEWVRENHLEK